HREGRRAARAAARERRPAPADCRPGPLRAGRPVPVRCPLRADTPATPARGLPGHPRHSARPAPQVRRCQVGSPRTPTHRTPAHPRGDQDACSAAGPGEPAVGAQTDPRGSWPDSGIGSLPRRSGRSSTPRAPARRRVVPVQPGASSWPPGPRGSSRHTSSTPVPRSARGCTHWCSSSTARGACTSPKVTARPTREWAVQQARNLAADLGMRRESLRFLLRDRDGTYGAAFDTVFEAEELEVILSAPRVPRMNAHCEKIIGSIRREMLDHVLIVCEAHARQVLAAYRRHYNAHRPHQARQQLPPDAKERPDATVHDLNTRRVLRTQILGGVISEYRCIA
ncbi:LOW QUALITY PROTEIN: integrase catalytic region, partial [Streptomyces viridosporus ATCC 14672]